MTDLHIGLSRFPQKSFSLPRFALGHFHPLTNVYAHPKGFGTHLRREEETPHLPPHTYAMPVSRAIYPTLCMHAWAPYTHTIAQLSLPTVWVCRTCRYPWSAISDATFCSVVSPWDLAQPCSDHSCGWTPLGHVWGDALLAFWFLSTHIITVCWEQTYMTKQIPPPLLSSSYPLK